MSRRATTVALVGHHLRSRAGGGMVVAALVLVLAVLGTAAPLLLGVLGDAALRDRLDVLGTAAPLLLGVLGDAALRDRLDVLSPVERDVQSDTANAVPQQREGLELPATTDEVWGRFVEQLERIRVESDEPLPGLLQSSRVVVRAFDSGPLMTGPLGAVTIAFDPDYEGEIRIVDGRLPEPGSGMVLDDPASSPDSEAAVADIEIVLSRESASQLDWTVGETRRVPGYFGPVELDLVGIFEAVDPPGDYWDHVRSVLTPAVFDDGNAARSVTVTGFAHPASLPATPLAVRWSTVTWYPLDVSKIDVDNAEQTVRALNGFTSVSHPVGSSTQGIGILSLRFSADVTHAIENALAQRAATQGVIVMIIAGPIGVAAAVLVLGCRVILEARRPALRLLSARGASVGQLRGLLGAEGVLVGLVPALVGALLVAVAGALLFGAAPAPAAWIPAVLIGLAPVAILFVLAPSTAERRARADLGRRGTRLRAIAEGAIAVLAVVAVALLFVRGYSGGVDPLLAAAPLLLALAACLLTLRLYPLPLRAIFARARASADLDSFLGSARALREPSIGLTPVLALVVGVSVAISSGILLSVLQSGIAEASRARIGADMRVAGAMFTPDQLEQVAGIEGVVAVTGISGADPATLSIAGVKRGTSVFVADAADLRAVQGDGPGMLPPGVSIEPVSDGPMPVVVSGAMADVIDDETELSLEGVDALVAGVTRGPVPIGDRESWVLIDSSYAEDVLGRDPNDRTLLLRIDPGAGGSVEASLRSVLGAAVRIDDAAAIAAEIESSPSVQGVRWALLAATAVAALLSALAIVMTLTLAAAPRARLLALLRTLGARPRSAASLALWEIGPPAVAAVIAGTVFGALVPFVVMAAVDLRPFTGSSAPPAYQIDPAILALTLGGFIALAVALTGIALLVSRRIRAAGALRTMEEG